MKKKSLLTIFVLSLLILLAYVLIVGAVDYLINSSGSNYYSNVVWETTLNGSFPAAQFGASVATCDVNNDSYMDVVVGSNYPDPIDTDEGMIFVFFGTADGISGMDDTSANLTFRGADYRDELYEVACGDVNNDNYDDVIGGAWRANVSGTDESGQAFVFFGADYTTIINGSVIDYANITLNGTSDSDRFGMEVDIGDINGDNYKDIIVAADKFDAPTSYDDQGRVYVFFGADYTSAVNEDASYYANITINGTNTDDHLGGNALATGDINNDSYDDLVIGGYMRDPNDLSFGGQAFVFFGADHTDIHLDVNDANITLNGTVPDEYVGYSVASGDVNNDSYADIIVGAMYANITNSTDEVGHAGKAYVFFGADYTSAISESVSYYANITLNGTEDSDYFGSSVASGDVNNDSFADVIVGAYGADPIGLSGAGQAFVFFGADHTDIYLSASAHENMTFNASMSSSNLGTDVASGDINNDSYADIIVGAPLGDPLGSANNGQVYIFSYDDVYPVISLDSPADFFNETATGFVTFNYTAIDTHLDYCELWGNWSGGWHMNESFVNPANGETNSSANISLEDGQYVWTVYCNDTGNNYNSSVGNYTLTVDLTAPVVGLDDPVDFFNETATGSVVFNFTSNDTLSSLDTCELWGNWSGGWHLNESFYTSLVSGEPYNSSNITIEDGLYVWSVYCNDTLGNSNMTVENRTLTVDVSTAPVVSLNAPVDFANFSTALDFNYTATDLTDVDTCELWGNWTSSGWHLNESFVGVTKNIANGSSVITLEDGQYVWSVYCNDTQNNYNNTVENFTLNIDLAAPVISLDEPVNFYNETVLGSFVFNYTANDTNLDTCELWGNWSGGWHLNESIVSPTSGETNGSSNISLEDGQYVWTVYCNDTGNNYNNTVANNTLTVDLTGPVVGLDNPVDFFNETATGSVVFNFTSNDSLSSLDTCELWGNWTTGWHLNDSYSTSLVNGEPYNSSNITLEEGLYVWSIYCNDTLGNTNKTVENRTLTVDYTAPVLTVSLPLNNTGDTDGLVYFNYTAIDALVGLDSCWLTINGDINVTNTTSEIPENFTVSLTEGSYDWNVSCNDSLNNVVNSDTYDLSVDLSTGFSGDTTDLSQVNVTNITNLVIEVPSDGKINFTDDVDLSNGSDLDTYVNISFNRIEVNVSSIPSDINKSAILYLYNLTFSNPKILMNDLDCPSDACTELSYTGGTLEFNVTGFSTYSAAETPTTTSPSTGGGSSSTGQGGYGCVDVSEGVVRTMSIDDAVVICLGESGGGSAGGDVGHQTVLDEMTSDSVTLLIYSTPIKVNLKVGETKKVDVDADGILDLLIELRSIDFAHQKSDVYFEDITPKKEAAPSEEVKEEEAAEEKPVVPTGEEPTAPEEAPSKAWVWVLVVLVIAVLIAVYFIAKKKGMTR